MKSSATALLLASSLISVLSKPIFSSSESSVRKSINFGPSFDYDVANDQSVALDAFNAKANDFSVGSLLCQGDSTCLGTALATSFVNALHPKLDFKLVDGYASSNTLVYHAHFVQLILHGKDKIAISNGNLNVNIDLATGNVVSYNDVAVKKDVGVSARRGIKEWATPKRLQQIVFGSPSIAIDSNTALTVNDPRHGLLAFLSGSADDVTTAFIASTSRSTLLASMPLSGTSTSMIIDNVPSAVSPVTATLVYVRQGDHLALTWKYVVESNLNHYEAYVTADNDIEGQEDVVQAIDWVRDYRPTGGELGLNAFGVNALNVATTFKGPSSPSPPKAPTTPSPPRSTVSPSYRVFPWGTNDPSEGKRALLKGTLVELDSAASPAGWHTVPANSIGSKPVYYDDTRGNNVMAQDNVDGGNQYINNYRPHAGVNMSFDFTLGLPKAGTPLAPRSYINASVTELFYTCNEIHDLFYRYGFDEVAGDFQEHNFGRGGRGNDAVQANAQDGSGYNNANFATPPDGSRPRMRMYVWNQQEPYRDGDLEAGIVIHEYSHGISTRLTGGPSNSGCLGYGEAGGMGEGWGDFFATMIRMHSAKETEFAMGEWASGRVGGIRLFRYSTNMTVNTDTYKTCDKPGYWGVHAIGEVWAEMLFEVAELLIEQHGFESTLFPPALGEEDLTGFYNVKYPGKKVAAKGNTLAVQLVVDGLKLQPCRPSFMDARDAILTADKVLTGGDNACLIWKGFAKRGLGPKATVVGSTPWGGGIRQEDYSVPLACK